MMERTTSVAHPARTDIVANNSSLSPHNAHFPSDETDLLPEGTVMRECTLPSLLIQRPLPHKSPCNSWDNATCTPQQHIVE